jgi:hypothetical protein
MATIITRLIQYVFPDKWDELNALDEKFTELENKIGFPPKRRYRLMVGNEITDTLVIEREFTKGMGQVKKLLQKYDADQEIQALMAELPSVVKDQSSEGFMILGRKKGNVPLGSGKSSPS